MRTLGIWQFRRLAVLCTMCVALLLPMTALAAMPAPAEQRAGNADSPVPIDNLENVQQAVVRIEAVAPDDAPSAAFLGRQREGSGVVLDDRTVLTIGYLIVETDEVMVHTRQGRRVPASVAGYDHQTGFGLVRTVLPLGLAGMALGDSDAIGERQRVLTLGHGEADFTELTVVSRKPFAGSWE